MELILFTAVVLALVVVAVVTYGATDRALHAYYRKLPLYRPTRDAVLYQER